MERNREWKEATRWVCRHHVSQTQRWLLEVGRSRGKIRAEGRRSRRGKDSQSPSFVCRIVCQLAPFLGHLTLPSTPLLAVSDLSLSSSPLWPCPLLIPYSLPFVWQASTQKWSLLLPPSTYHLAPFSATFPPSSMSGSFSLRQSSLSFFLFIITIKMVAVETRLFRNGGIIYSCALSVDFDATVWMRVHMLLWRCALIFSECVCLRVCMCTTHPFSRAPLIHAFHIWRALFVPNLWYRHCYHGYSQRGPLTQWQTQWPWQPQDQWWVIW